MADRRPAALAAGLFAAVSVLGLVVLPVPPTANAGTAEVHRWFSGQHDRVVLGGLVMVASGLLAGVLAVLLRRVVGGAGGDVTALGGTVLATSVSVAGLLCCTVAQDQERLGDAGVGAVWPVLRVAWLLVPPAATLLVAVGVAVAPATLLPSWYRGLSGLLALAAVVACVLTASSRSGAAQAFGFFGFLLTIAWSGATAVALGRQGESATAARGAMATA